MSVEKMQVFNCIIYLRNGDRRSPTSIISAHKYFIPLALGDISCDPELKFATMDGRIRSEPYARDDTPSSNTIGSDNCVLRIDEYCSEIEMVKSPLEATRKVLAEKSTAVCLIIL